MADVTFQIRRRYFTHPGKGEKGKHYVIFDITGVAIRRSIVAWGPASGWFGHQTVTPSEAEDRAKTRFEHGYTLISDDTYYYSGSSDFLSLVADWNKKRARLPFPGYMEQELI